jgi:ubiquinone/menaquinone biosynthesis C-methylase UbiE
MTDDLERKVASHYGGRSLLEGILAALKAAGLDPDKLTPEALGAVDEFHIGGHQATQELAARMLFGAGQQVLDVGCGIGGAARFLAYRFGCRVTGIDLTPEYILVARDLTRRTDLEGEVVFEVASALDMPFPEGRFDAAITFHVAMNIKDRDRLYREVARVLKAGARFCVYDVMKGPNPGLDFPVPWAESAETSHLTTPAETERLLEQAGFTSLNVRTARRSPSPS